MADNDGGASDAASSYSWRDGGASPSRSVVAAGIGSCSADAGGGSSGGGVVIVGSGGGGPSGDDGDSGAARPAIAEVPFGAGARFVSMTAEQLAPRMRRVVLGAVVDRRRPRARPRFSRPYPPRARSRPAPAPLSRARGRRH